MHELTNSDGMTRKRCGRCNEVKSLEEFPLDSKGVHGRHGYCRECKAAYMRKRVREMRDDGRLFKENLMRALRRFGLTWEYWLNHPQVCEICKGGPSGKMKRLVTDHDHETGEFRGLLCGRCNSILGYVNDDPEVLRVAADYLDTHNARRFTNA